MLIGLELGPNYQRCSTTYVLFATDGIGYWFLMSLCNTGVLGALYGYLGYRFNPVISLSGKFLFSCRNVRHPCV